MTISRSGRHVRKALTSPTRQIAETPESGRCDTAGICSSRRTPISASIASGEYLDMMKLNAHKEPDQVVRLARHDAASVCRPPHHHVGDDCEKTESVPLWPPTAAGRAAIGFLRPLRIGRTMDYSESLIDPYENPYPGRIPLPHPKR